MSEQKTVMLDELKKSTVVHYCIDGVTIVRGTLQDNKKGVVMRQIHLPEQPGLPFMENCDMYVDRITEALVDGEWCRVVLSESQKRRLAEVHKFGF